MNNYLRRLSRLVLILVIGMIAMGNVVEMFAQNRVTFSLLNRRAVGTMYYAELWATVATNSTWIVGNSLINVHFNSAALSRPASNLTVFDADPEISGTISYSAHYQSNYGTGLSYNIILNPNPTRVTKTGTFKIGTFRFLINNPNAMDDLTFSVPPAGDRSDIYHDESDQLGYDCGNASCYGVVNPVSRLVGLPVITAEPTNQTTCSGQAVSFGVTVTGSSISYQWQYATTTNGTFTDVSGANSANLTISPATSGNVGAYRVVVTNTTGTVTSSVVTLVVNSTPVVTAQPANQAGCVGGSATFTVSYTSSVPATVQWQVFNSLTAAYENIPGATSNTLTLSNLTTAQSESYRAQLTNSCGVTNSNPATLTVNSTPVVNNSPANQAGCVGSSVSFSANAASALGHTTQWEVSVNGGGQFAPIAGETSGTLTLTNIQVAQSGNQYRAVFTNICGSTASGVAVLTVNTVPVVATQPSNVTACEAQTATFTASATGTPAPSVSWEVSTNTGATWSAVADATTGTLTVSNVSAAQNGYQYRAVFSNTCGTVMSTVATLNVNTAPVVAVQPQAQTACENTSVSFTATANSIPAPSVQWQVSVGTSGTWTNIQGAVSNTYTLNAVQFSQNGEQYRAVFTNVCGTTNSNAAVLTVNRAPQVATVAPSAQTICAGSQVTFTASSTGGSPASTIQWQSRPNSAGTFTNVSGATSASYTFTTTAANNGSEYRAIFTNVCGSTTSNVAVLTVNNVATIINQPVNTAQCIGGTVTFTATATGTPNPTIQWQVSTNGGTNYTDLSNGGDISGAQTTTLTVSNIAVSQNNNLYRANFINTCGTVSSLGAVLTVNVAPVVTANPTSLEVCTNSSATFTAAATATPAASVQWQVSAGTSGTWTNIQGANGTSFTITSATLAQSGNQYRAIFTNACGSSTSASATLTVSQGPTIAMNPVDNTVCEGTSVTFMSQATGVPAPTAQWEVRANSNAQWMPIAGANAPNYTITNPTFAMNGSQYRVVYTNACGMTPTSFAVLTVNTAPVVSTQPQDQTVCAGDNATFTVAATGSPVASIQWEVSTNGGTNYTAIQGANSTTYTFTAGPNDDGNMYRARFTNICGDVTSTAAMLNFYALPQIVQQPTAVSVCQGESFTLTVGAVGTGLTYQWRKDGIDIPNSNSASYTVASASAANAGFYSVVVSNICNQPVVSNPISVVVNLTPVITVQPVPVTVCQGGFAQFFVQATGTGLSYQWRRNNTDIPGATNTFYNIPAATPADAGVYSVAITGACGTPVVSNNAQLTVETAPVVTTQPADITVCEGNSATFTVAASGSNLSYQWMFNGQNIANATGATLVLNSVTAASAGSYSVTITGSCPTPVTSRLAALTVNANPVIVSNVQDQVVCAGNAVTFNVGATGTGLTYQWYFNNSPITGAVGSSYTINPANFGNAGDYYVLISGACTTNNPVRSRTASLTVYENVVITRQPESAVVCVDGTVILSVGASGTGFPGDGLRYQWYKDGQLIPSATENQFVISNAQFFAGGNYSVTVTGVCGTVVSNDAIVVVNRRASAVLNEPRNKRVAVGDDVVFEVSDVSGAGTTFQWYKDGEPLTDIPGKIVGSQSSKLYIYDVQQSDESNNYYVIVSGCGTATSELASLNLFNPNIQFTEQPVDVTACTNGTVTLTALATTNIENGTISYQWFRNGIAITGATQRTLTITSATIADAGTYRVEATETSKQLTVTSNNANVIITAAPVIATQPVSVRECENSMVSLTVVVNPEAGDVRYQWFKDSAPIDPALNPTATTATLMGPVVTLTVGSYTVVVTNDCGTTTSEPATVGMKEKTVITQQPQNVQLEVLGVSELRLTVTAVGENCSYQWKLNGNNIPGATSNEYVVTRPTTSDLGNYTVDVICECSTTTSSVAVVTGFTTDVDFPVAGEGFYLGQNYPNPFGGQTSISYMTPTSTDVRISVTDMYGREVAVLVDGVVNAGTHTVKFDASQLPSGTYFYTMTASGFNTSRRMLLVK